MTANQKVPQVAIPLPKGKKRAVEIGSMMYMLFVAFSGLSFGHDPGSGPHSDGWHVLFFNDDHSRVTGSIHHDSGWRKIRRHVRQTKGYGPLRDPGRCFLYRLGFFHGFKERLSLYVLPLFAGSSPRSLYGIPFYHLRRDQRTERCSQSHRLINDSHYRRRLRRQYPGRRLGGCGSIAISHCLLNHTPGHRYLINCKQPSQQG